MNYIYNKTSLCKEIKALHKQGFDPNVQTLPFEMAKSRFIEGDYQILHVSGDTSTHTKELLYNVMNEDKHLVYCLEKENFNGIEMIGIVHLIKHSEN